MIVFGYGGMGWIFYLMVAYTPPWTWGVTLLTLVAIMFGAFASRDLRSQRND